MSAGAAPVEALRAVRLRTLERFREHRQAWQGNVALRTLYGDWYRRVAEALPAPSVGPRLEIGSGPGFAREFIPDLLLSDVVKAEWHDREVAADALPFADASLGALVLFDVLHHLPSPSAFFAEAVRVLRHGGRIVMCEPYLSPLSWPVYRFAHPEPVDTRVDPLAVSLGRDKDPFDSNQAIPTVLFTRQRAAFEARFPDLSVEVVERLAGPSYVASGGFSHRAAPGGLWQALLAIERRLPKAVFRWIGFRLLVVVSRR